MTTIAARPASSPSAWSQRPLVVVLLTAVALLSCARAENGPPVSKARGNEPFWAVTFDGEEATFRTPDLPDGIKYREGRWKRKGTAAVSSTWCRNVAQCSGKPSVQILASTLRSRS